VLKSELLFLLRRLTGAIAGLIYLHQYNQTTLASYVHTYREGTSTPSTTTTNLREIGKDWEDSLVAQWHVDDTMMGQSRHGSDASALLATTESTCAHEQTGILAPESTLLPLATSRIPEGLPLSWEIAVSGGDAEEEGIVLLKLAWVLDGWDAVVLWWSVHLLEDLSWECLLDLEEVDLATGLFNALGLLLREGLDVAPCGVLEVPL
jgi:hypothetical protein